MAKKSIKGYKADSPDRHEPMLTIPSGMITMKNVPFPVMGMDNMGNMMMMMPGGEYHFPGSEVTEVPMKKGGQLTPNKAREILHDKKVHGKKLTDKQRKFFGAMSKGNTMDYKDGGGIHIDPSKKGTFTAAAKKHGMSVQAFASHVLAHPDEYTPVMRKKANFARNASKWKHELGGIISEFQAGGDVGPEGTTYNPITGMWEDPSGNFVYDPTQPVSEPSNINPNISVNLPGPKNIKDQALAQPKLPAQMKQNLDAQLKKKKSGFDTVPALNAFNMLLTKLTEGLQQREYEKQMRQLMNQPSINTLTPYQQYGNPQAYQRGGVIPEDISYMAASIPNFYSAPRPAASAGNTAATAAPVTNAAADAGTTAATAASMSGDFSDYALKANKYLKRRAPNTDITGEMLASAAQQAYIKYGKMVPVELALAQLAQEGYLAKGKGNKPQRTKNPFNVGNTDDGSVVYHSNVQSGIDKYYDLIASSYLKDKTPDQLLEHFVNTKGNRYASAKNYEVELKKRIAEMQFKEGGVYDMSPNQIAALRAQGYTIDEIND